MPTHEAAFAASPFWREFRPTEPLFDLFGDIVVSGDEKLAKPDARIFDLAIGVGDGGWRIAVIRRSSGIEQFHHAHRRDRRSLEQGIDIFVDNGRASVAAQIRQHEIERRAPAERSIDGQS